MSEVLNTAFYLPFGKRGVSRDAAEAAIVQDLLCYRSVWLLTDQMGAVPRLIELMGLDAFEEAVSEGALKFIHERQIFAWPAIPGYGGLVPFDLIASLPQSGYRGFTQMETKDLAARLLMPSMASLRHVRALAAKIENATIDFAALEDMHAKPADEATRDLLLELKSYEVAAATMPEIGLRPSELAKLRREIAGRKGDRFLPEGQRKYKVMSTGQFSGPRALEPERALPPRQLALLNLVLAGRFLSVHAKLPAVATMHTEPAVERVLEAKAAQLRKAAGKEVEVVLDGERVLLPVLSRPGPFPYSELLKARSTIAGFAFQTVVERRDQNVEAELLQEYLASMRTTDRFVVRLARLIVGRLLGTLEPTGGMAAGLGIDYLFSRREARVYVDEHLRRLSDRTN